MSRNIKNTQSIQKLSEESLSEITGGGGKHSLINPRSKVASIKSNCIHGFAASCEKIGVVHGGTKSFEKCQFLKQENDELICVYDGTTP